MKHGIVLTYLYNWGELLVFCAQSLPNRYYVGWFSQSASTSVLNYVNMSYKPMHG